MSNMSKGTPPPVRRQDSQNPGPEVGPLACTYPGCETRIAGHLRATSLCDRLEDRVTADDRTLDHEADDGCGNKAEDHCYDEAGNRPAASGMSLLGRRWLGTGWPGSLEKLAAEPALYCHGLDGFAAERTGLGRLGQYSCGLSTCLAVGDNPAGLAATILANEANTGAIRTKATTLVRGGVALVGHRRRSWDAWSQGHGRRHCLGA